MVLSVFTTIVRTIYRVEGKVRRGSPLSSKGSRDPQGSKERERERRGEGGREAGDRWREREEGTGTEINLRRYINRYIK